MCCVVCALARREQGWCLPEEKLHEGGHLFQWERSEPRDQWKQGETDTPHRLWEGAGLFPSMYRERVRLFRVKTQKSRGFGNSQATQTWLIQETGFHIQSFTYSKFWSWKNKKQQTDCISLPTHKTSFIEMHKTSLLSSWLLMNFLTLCCLLSNKLHSSIFFGYL